MRVFISSVRQGLEEERDALPGIIAATGHQPVRFEDYTAQSIPSRQACLEGVQSADAYLLLLGPRYGHRFEDTGQSPTHEEWVTARTMGIPRLVFRKVGVDFEAEQLDFARVVGDYAAGVFYAEFSSTHELLTKVVSSLRALERTAPPLSFSPLTAPLPVLWRGDFPENSHNSGYSERATLEVHVLPIGAERRSVRTMAEIADSLPGRLRETGQVPHQAALAPSTGSDGAITVSFPETQRRWDEPPPARPLGVRLDPSGQLSLWGSLPGDRMGSVLDESLLPAQIADSLRLLGSLHLVETDNVAIAVGVDHTMLLTAGNLGRGERTHATMLRISDSPVRVPPDESVTLPALDVAATEVARPLARALLRATLQP